MKTPFGLAIAPAIFQKFINAIFKEYIDCKVVVVYIDDVIILANTNDEALTRLRQVVNLVQQHGLQINWKKCKFLQREIEYLDHIVSKNTVRPTMAKIKAVQHFPLPTSVKSL